MKRFVEYFKKPPIWLILIVYLLTIASATASIVLVCLGVDNVGVYILYGVAGVALAYSVYTIIKFAPKIKNGTLDILRSFSFTRRLLDQYDFRTIIVASASLFINIAYAILNLVIGIISSSYWFIAIAIYHTILILLRSDTILSRSKNQKSSYLRCSLLLMLLSVFLGLSVWQMVVHDLAFVRYGWTIYACAMYAFYKIITSIINLFKIQNKELTIKAIKYIGFADALFSILALQTSLLYTFSDEALNTGIFNAVTGSVVVLLTFGIGVNMLITIINSRRNNERK